MSSLSTKLRTIRRFTGDRFSVERGYDWRQKMSRKRLGTIERYYNAIQDMLARPHRIYEPPRGTKKEVFQYTGQAGYRYFTKAIVHTPDVGARYKFLIDKKRKKGSRFLVVNRRSGEVSWHIPKEVFWDVTDPASEDVDPEYFQDVLEQWAEDAEIFLINAGEYHMWGSAGAHEQVAKKLADLFEQYGAGNFDAADKGSHFIGNWFRGITAFSNRLEIDGYIDQRRAKRSQHQRELDIPVSMTTVRLRLLRDGEIGLYYDGRQLMRFSKFMLPVSVSIGGEHYVIRLHTSKTGGESVSASIGRSIIATVYLDSGYDTS